MSLAEALFFVGIDWAAKVHAVCVLDQTGRKVTAFTIEHTAAGFANLAARLGKLGVAEVVPVAIERPDGRLVDALLEAGHPVVPVKPNAIKTWRDGEVLSGAKSDAGDAQVIAEYLRLRTHRLRPAAPYSASFPRAGLINAAQILAEWGDARDAYAGPEAIAALGGLVPVTRASGKHRGVSFRWACNKRLRVAITTFADNSRHASPWAAEVYARARARGKDHPHAIRILARAWVRIIYRCWITGQPYDPNRHNGARPHLSTAQAA